MLKILLCLAGLLGTGAPLLAQSHQPVSVLASPDEQERPALGNTPGSRSVNRTVRVPARTSVYNWVQASGQWATQAVVTTSVYDAQGMVTSAVSADSVTQRPLTRKTYTRDVNGVTSLYFEEEWTGSAWQNRIQWINALDSQGRLLEQIQQQWINGAWNNTARYVQGYHSRGGQTLYQRYEWLNGSWVMQDASEALPVFDALDRVQQVVTSMYDSSTGQMNQVFRDTYNYPGNASLYESMVQERVNYGSWANDTKYTYAYDTQGRVTGRQGHSWTAGAWKLTSRLTKTYDAATNSYVELAERLTGSSWVNNTRITANYDVFGNDLGSVHEFWTTNAWQVSLARAYVLKYSADSDVIVKLYRAASGNPLTLANNTKTYYSNFQSYILATRPTTKVAANWQLYPNPSTGRVTLAPAAGHAARLRTVEVVNSLGQVVRQQHFGQAAGVQPVLELGSLVAGLYTLRLQTDNGTELHRLQKE